MLLLLYFFFIISRFVIISVPSLSLAFFLSVFTICFTLYAFYQSPTSIVFRYIHGTLYYFEDILCFCKISLYKVMYIFFIRVFAICPGFLILVARLSDVYALLETKIICLLEIRFVSVLF